MEKLSFLFYLNWKVQINDLDDQELRRFINNLINYHLGEPIVLESKTDRIVWNGVLPGLEANQKKYNKRVEASSKSGQLGGAPLGNQNARKYETTQNNPNNLIRDNSKKGNENREMLNENSEEETGNNKLETEKWKELIDESKIENEDFGARDTGSKKLGLDESIPTQKSLQDLRKEQRSNDNQLRELKVQIIAATSTEKEILTLIKNEDWATLEASISPDKQEKIKPLIEVYIPIEKNLLKINRELELRYKVLNKKYLPNA